MNAEYGVPVLKLYNDCRFGEHAVSANFLYVPKKEPGSVTGVFTVRTTANGLHTKVKSVIPSEGLTLVNNTQLFNGAEIDSAVR